MTEYLKAYMKTVSQRLENCAEKSELDEILAEHKDKISFMQHERIVHFLVTMMFAIILVIFISVLLFTENIAILALVTIILVLLGFYIKHYYFLENTVQKMYVTYDDILKKYTSLAQKENNDD
ncbi:MAG: hypothetical protein PUB97_10545 [Ruminococcus sp.]|nr:hypothetical protein [Ruminococcus sp.]